MKNVIVLMAVVSMMLTGCTADQTALSATQTEQWDAMKIPVNKRICTVYANYKDYSVAQLQKMYKKDMAAAESTYAGTLSSMWYDIICARIKDTYNNTQKMAFLQQEAKRSSLVPNFNSFYKLLSTCKDFETAENLNALANLVYNKSKATIENIPNEKHRHDLMLSLNYSKRIYTMLVVTPEGTVTAK